MAWSASRLGSAAAPAIQRPLLFLVLWLLSAAQGIAQGTDQDWRTLEIPGYRFHTPAQLEPWTLELVTRMGAIHDAVTHEVGYSPEDTVDVLVVDPIARANGVAWPILGKPRMVLYATPPEAGGSLAQFQHWPELLTIHETAHLAHLLRPSRNPLKARLETLVPVGPLPLKTPNWTIEGYATLLEGKLTGFGRPNGDMRAALLRRWAQTGRLPTYGQLSGSSRRFMGRSFPYWVGSAYLEWLEQRSDEDALRRLWARLSARQDRGFDDAFRGVFGDGPGRLYQRFTAELTYRAMGLEAARKSSLKEGELWQDLAWHTGAPALSPDGERLAVVVRRRGLPSTLVIWSTSANDEAEEGWRERQAEIVALDPEDVEAERRRPLPRTPIHQLPSRHGAEPRTPRFTADGESLLFSRLGPATAEADFPGARISDLYRWWPGAERVERVTANAGVRAADPHPDGTWAVAVGQAFGYSRLVRVDLETGRVTPLDDASLSHAAVDHPRFSPDGSRLAYLVHHDGAWQLRIRDMRSGAERRLPTPLGALLAQPAWTADGESVVVSVGSGGFIELFDYGIRFGARRQLTRSPGGAMAPAPSRDGAVYYLALEDDGYDIRRLAVGDAGEPTAVPPWQPADLDLATVAPAVRPEPIAAKPMAIRESPASRPYGLGPREYLPLVGGAWNADGGRVELGVRQGDPVGRLRLRLLGATGDAETGFHGAALTLRDHRSAVDWGLHLFYGERAVPRSSATVGAPSLSPSTRSGAELSLGDGYLRSQSAWRWDAGLLWQRRDADPRWARGSIFARGAGRIGQRWGSMSLGQSLSVELQRGRTRVEHDAPRFWTRGKLGLGLRLSRQPANGTPWSIGLQWRAGQLRGGSPAERFHLGGQRGSLLPTSAVDRWSAAALDSFSGLGDRVRSERINLTVSSLPFTLFGERHRIWDQGAARPPWIRVAGLEWTFSQGEEPLLRLPGVDVAIGVGRLLDTDQTRGWISLRWRP